MLSERPDHATLLATLADRRLLPDRFESVYLTGSLIRGWGNAGSDYDFYVIGHERWLSPSAEQVVVALEINQVSLETFEQGGREWDVEYWQDAQVDELLGKVSWQCYRDNGDTGGLLTVFERDFLERLRYAEPLVGQDWWNRRREQLSASAFIPMIVQRALHNARSSIDDATGMLASGDVRSAVIAARIAFTASVDALLSHHGSLARSPKWHARRFAETEQDVLSEARYWAIETMQGLDPAHPQAWVADVLRVCTDIRTAVQAGQAGPHG